MTDPENRPEELQSDSPHEETPQTDSPEVAAEEKTPSGPKKLASLDELPKEMFDQEQTSSEGDGPPGEGESKEESQNGEAPAGEEKEPVHEAVMEERLEKMRRKQQRQGKVPHIPQDQDFFSSAPPDEVLEEELERELAEAMGGMSEEELLGELSPDKRPEPQSGPPGKKKGKIISVHGPDVFVEIPGNRSQGVLPITQFGEEEKPEIGSEVDIQIEGYDNANGLLILTRKGAAVEADWSTIATGMVVEARVTETNKGGLTVIVNGIRGFMPISQIDMFRVENAEQFVNEKLLCVVTEADQANRNLVVSRRALLEREREEKREQMWNEIAEGQIVEGVVRSVQNFGAFVDLGGIDGLLHVSEMSWTKVKRASDVLEPGQRIKVIVLRVDREHRKIGLGLKQLTPSPWDDVDIKYPIGGVVMGKVSRLAEFGAFVELEPAIEGLVHISELASRKVRRTAEAVQLEQEVKVQVLDIDKDRRRISLSIRAAMAKDVEEVDEEETPDEAAEEKKVKQSRPRTTPLKGGVGGQSGYLIPRLGNDE